MKDITQELKNYMKNNGYTQESLAEKMGVSQARIQQLLSGKKPFGKKTASQWHDLFGFNTAWLLTGEGEMMADVQHAHHIVNGNHSTINNNSSDPSTIEAILRLTKMLEQERAEKEEWKRKYLDIINKV